MSKHNHYINGMKTALNFKVLFWHGAMGLSNLLVASLYSLKGLEIGG